MAILTQRGLKVEVANNGREAIAMLNEVDRFDGVLMDCQMPVLDGYEATQIIRANPVWRDLPILAMTANATKADIGRTMNAGMNGHIGKPVNVVKLFSKLTH